MRRRRGICITGRRRVCCCCGCGGRYLLVNVQEQEVYELDPDKVKVQGENVEWSPSDLPTDPIETSEWKTRDVGPMRRVKFRFGKTGNFLDIQLPLLINGKPAY